MSGEASYRVTVGKQAFDVMLESVDDRLVARIGGREYAVALHARGPHARTLTQDDLAVEALIADSAAGTWVALDGYQAEVAVIEARALRLAASLPRRAAQSERVDVRAPMPGRVISVRVAVGDTVERNTLVAILEAMKMQNELRAPHAGRVADVRVAEGETVEHGALLVRLEPLSEG